MGGLVVTEQVFNFNGIGMLFEAGVSRNDYTLIQALVMLVAGALVVMNLLIDLLYALDDPLIRYDCRRSQPFRPRPLAAAPARARPRVLPEQPLGAVGFVVIFVILFAASSPIALPMTPRDQLRRHPIRAVVGPCCGTDPLGATSCRASSTVRGPR